MTDEMMNDGMESAATGKFSSADAAFLSAAARWAELIAFIYLIYETLLLLFSSVGLSVLASANYIFSGGIGGMASWTSLLSLALEIATFWPAVYLYRFSQRMKKAVLQSDGALATEAFMNLKKTFKLLGVILLLHILLFMLSSLLAGGWLLSKVN